MSDEFDLPAGQALRTPAREGLVLLHGDGSGQLKRKETKTYRSGSALV